WGVPCGRGGKVQKLAGQALRTPSGQLFQDHAVDRHRQVWFALPHGNDLLHAGSQPHGCFFPRSSRHPLSIANSLPRRAWGGRQRRPYNETEVPWGKRGIAAGKMAMRLLTYNIHKGVGGSDRRYRLERAVAVIAAEEPDLVCLQEVDRHVR